jgi:hypothetical protein
VPKPLGIDREAPRIDHEAPTLTELWTLKLEMPNLAVMIPETLPKISQPGPL